LFIFNFSGFQPVSFRFFNYFLDASADRSQASERGPTVMAATRRRVGSVSSKPSVEAIGERRQIPRGLFGEIKSMISTTQAGF